jgi:hypothetical protein
MTGASQTFTSVNSVTGLDRGGEEEWALKIAEGEVSQSARSQAVDAYVSQCQQSQNGLDGGPQSFNGGADVALQALKLLDGTVQPESR